MNTPARIPPVVRRLLVPVSTGLAFVCLAAGLWQPGAGLYLLPASLGFGTLAGFLTGIRSRNRFARLALSGKRSQLALYQEQLVKLAKHEALSTGDLPALYASVCEAARESLPVSRVSIWLTDEGYKTLTRRFLVEAGRPSDQSEFVLDRSVFPGYFRALLTKPFIMADEARTHPDTREFTESYLDPLGILSMIDCPILIDRQTAGVICCEHQHEIRQWEPEDALFVQSLADLIAMALQNARIRALLEEVRHQNTALRNQSEEIRSMNESLETTVRERTAELERQNRQLSEYAFINAHLLRAPLSRIIGLTHLLAAEQVSSRERELVDGLIVSAQELDGIIKQIGEMLHTEGRLSSEAYEDLLSDDPD